MYGECTIVDVDTPYNTIADNQNTKNRRKLKNKNFSKTLSNVLSWSIDSAYYNTGTGERQNNQVWQKACMLKKNQKVNAEKRVDIGALCAIANYEMEAQINKIVRVLKWDTWKDKALKEKNSLLRSNESQNHKT